MLVNYLLITCRQATDIQEHRPKLNGSLPSLLAIGPTYAQHVYIDMIVFRVVAYNHIFFRLGLPYLTYVHFSSVKNHII